MTTLLMLQTVEQDKIQFIPPKAVLVKKLVITFYTKFKKKELHTYASISKKKNILEYRTYSCKRNTLKFVA